MTRFVLLTLCCFLGSAVAEEPVEIPRSTQVELTDPATKRVYPIYIKVPRSFASNPDKAYPVIYLTDGLYSFQIASGATQLYDKLMSEGGDNLTVKFMIIDEAKHATAFPTTLIQGLDWLYGLPR